MLMKHHLILSFDSRQNMNTYKIHCKLGLHFGAVSIVSYV